MAGGGIRGPSDLQQLRSRGEAVGLPADVLDRLGPEEAGVIRAVTRWIEELEAASSHAGELDRRLVQPGDPPVAEEGEDTRAAQERARRAMGLEAARRLADQDPGAALQVLDDTSSPLPPPVGRARARGRMLELAAREGSLGIIPALDAAEQEDLQAAETPEEAMAVIIRAARRVRSLARAARERVR